jgi:peroxiredoxin family protein
MELSELTNIGALALVVMFTIKEGFEYLKKKKNPNEPMMAGIFQELQLMNNNHLDTLQHTIEDNNRELVKAVNDGNVEIIKVLCKIDGRLSK